MSRATTGGSTGGSRATARSTTAASCSPPSSGWRWSPCCSIGSAPSATASCSSPITCALLAAFLDLGLGTAVTRDVASADPDGARFVRSAGPAFLAVGVAGAVLLTASRAPPRTRPASPQACRRSGGVRADRDRFCRRPADRLPHGGPGRRAPLRRRQRAARREASRVRAAGTLAVLAAGGGTAAVARLVRGDVVAARRARTSLTVRAHGSAARLLRLVGSTRAALRSRLSYGTGSLAIMVSLGALWNAGPLIVAAISGAAASALFAVSQRFPMGALALPERISVVLFPAAGQADANSAWLIARGTRLTLTALLPVAVVLLAGAEPVLDAWLDQVPPDGPLVLRLHHARGRGVRPVRRRGAGDVGRGRRSPARRRPRGERRHRLRRRRDPRGPGRARRRRLGAAGRRGDGRGVDAGALSPPPPAAARGSWCPARCATSPGRARPARSPRREWRRSSRGRLAACAHPRGRRAHRIRARARALPATPRRCCAASAAASRGCAAPPICCSTCARWPSTRGAATGPAPSRPTRRRPTRGDTTTAWGDRHLELAERLLDSASSARADRRPGPRLR